MIARNTIETAYSFFHQKQRVFQYSPYDWQKDDIECAISAYVEDMDQELYEQLSNGRNDYLVNHATFGEDLLNAVEAMEKMLGI